MINMLKATKKLAFTKNNEIEDSQFAYVIEFYKNLYFGKNWF